MKKADMEIIGEEVLQQDTLSTQDKQECLTEIHKIERTPFTVIRDKEKVLLVMGEYLFNEYETMEEAMEDSKVMTWDRIMQVIQAMITHDKKENKLIPNKN